MTRIEENVKAVDKVAKINDDTPVGSFETMVSLQLCSIDLLLRDISKSLAVIAEKSESEMNILEKSFNESKKEKPL